MQKSRFISPRECTFCGARVKLSGEHVFADWLAPYLPNVGFSGHTTSQHLHARDGSTMASVSKKGAWHQGILHDKNGPSKGKTLKIVCTPCNSMWMSRLQDQVKPILLPMLNGSWPDEIHAWDRRILAAWAVMFTMVIEFADLPTQVTTFAEREKLRLTSEPPPNWHVWIGLHKGPLWTLGFNHFGWSRPKFVSPHEDQALAAKTLAASRKEVQCTGWVVGPIYFQTFSANVPGFVVDNAVFAEKHGLRVVWPNDGLSIDRPIKVMDDLEADNASAGLRPGYLAGMPRRRAWEILNG